MSHLEKIKQYITKHSLIKQNDVIIIGLSGGPDSVFLLHQLVALQKKYNLTLIAAHLNHEWRTEADSEEQMCRAIAQNLNINFISTKISSVTTIKKYNGSKEEFARNMRRQFLEDVARKHNADSIALGHHAQDQQETFFIRLIRGTSLAGLTSMQPRSGLYIRPLLETNKSDIVAWLNAHSITYALDASNESGDYLRNRIRSTVLPALAECDQRWNSNFLATISRLKQDDALLNDIAETALKKITIMANPDNQTKPKNLLCARQLEPIFSSFQWAPNSNEVNIGQKGYLRAHTLDTLQFIATHPSLHYRIIMLWLIKNSVPFSTSQAFLDEIIRFLCNPNGGTHAIHEQWSLVKKQNKAWIKKID